MEHDAGGAGGRPYTPIFTNIDVVPDDLAGFAELLRNDLDAIQDAWERLRTEMEAGPNPNFPGGYPSDVSLAKGYPEVLGNASPGIAEGQGFNYAYFLTVGAERMLMDDVIKGYQTLQRAATMIHNDYLDREADNASDLEGAFAAYEREAVVEALGESRPEPGEGGDDGAS